ncbi:MAG TPA: PIN domain-containing protein [Thermomicrobiales bacterium]|nr:PIN domain-containing protein [Thermomicrobiales bacterium]
MPRFLLDTSCIVAVLCSWHEHHERAVREVERRLDDGGILVVAAPTLVETYAVLTRLPPPRRLSPVDSRTLLDVNFLSDETETVALDAVAYRHLVQSAPERSIAGGRIYDAVIVACAQAARVETLLTFNERQFVSLADDSLQIVVPS